MNPKLTQLSKNVSKDAQKVFDTLGIEQSNWEAKNYSEIPSFQDNSNSKTEKSELFWTRLSMNSNPTLQVD